MDLTKWHPINNCWRLSPHTEYEPEQNAELNAMHRDPENPFKDDWGMYGWRAIAMLNGLPADEDTPGVVVTCGKECPVAPDYACTEARGHTGSHAAGDGHHVQVVWPNISS